MNLKNILKIIDNNILFVLSLFLLAFIPLYPKWPLFDVLEGYNVRIRLDDVLVLLTFFIWLVYVLRGKIKLKEIPLFKPVVIYLIIGFLSVLSALFITKTVLLDTYQIAKIFLHWFRRIEYFSLFFVFYSAVYNKKNIKAYLITLISTILGVTIYGYGQKYLYWPAYSTMNREFSKGIRLYLSEHARVLSTFSGHYDLAAYIMLTLLVLIVLAFITKKIWLKILLLFFAILEYWLLNLTASRTSFLAFLGALSIAFFFLGFKKSWQWSFKRWFVVSFICVTIMLSIGDLSDRFSQVVHMEDLKNKVNITLNNIRFGKPPDNSMAVDDNFGNVIADSDIPPSPQRPADVAYAPPILTEIASTSGEASEATYVLKPRDFSDNAMKYGLSMGIRFDTLWPNAINAFLQNPLLGTGYSTLVKAKLSERTTAESTDNDFLRALGETGALGFLTFMAILFICFKTLYLAFRKTDEEKYYGLFAVGMAMIVGMLINATLIDVFESSKVAYSFWTFMGILMALAYRTLNQKKNSEK